MFNLSVRKHKLKTKIGGVTKWEFEVGLDIQPFNMDENCIIESSSNVNIFDSYVLWLFVIDVASVTSLSLSKMDD